MADKIRRPRITVKAIIVDRGKILTIKKSDKDGDWLVLPGGGQKGGETLVQALERECQEELGARNVKVQDLVFLRDYIGKNHEFQATSSEVHQVDHFFFCRLEGDLVKPLKPDKDQVGLVWVDIEALGTLNFYPKELVPPLQAWAAGSWKGCYLGDIN